MFFLKYVTNWGLRLLTDWKLFLKLSLYQYLMIPLEVTTALQCIQTVHTVLDYVHWFINKVECVAFMTSAAFVLQ